MMKIYKTIILFVLINSIFIGCSKTDPKNISNGSNTIDEVKPLNSYDLVLSSNVISFGSIYSNQQPVKQTIYIKNNSNERGRIQISKNTKNFEIDSNSTCVNNFNYKILNAKQSCLLTVKFDPSKIKGVVNDSVYIKDLASNLTTNFILTIPVYGISLPASSNELNQDTGCKKGYHAEGRRCVSNFRSCDNNLGSQLWENGSWGLCNSGKTLTVYKDLNQGTILDNQNLSKIYCDETCETQSNAYNIGSNIILRAIPKIGYKIDNWSGCPSISSDKQFCTINNLTENKLISVQYSKTNLKLKIFPSDDILAQKVAPINVYKNGTICTSDCLNNVATGDQILVEANPTTEVSIRSFNFDGYIVNKTNTSNSVSFNFANTDVSVIINLQIKDTVSAPVVVIDNPATYTPSTPIIDIETGGKKSIRCYNPEDIEQVMTNNQSRMSLNSVIISQDDPLSKDQSNVLNNIPSYYGWVYIESSDKVMECYDFSLDQAPQTEFSLPTDTNNPNNVSVRCYNSASIISIFNDNEVLLKRNDVNATIVSQATPIELDNYNVNYRSPIYKGWIESNNEIRRCYEFSGDILSSVGNSTNVFEDLVSFLGEALGGATSYLGDLAGIVSKNIPSAKDALKKINDIFEGFGTGLDPLQPPNLKPLIGSIGKGAGNLGEALVEEIKNISIGKPDYEQVIKLVNTIAEFGDGAGHTIEDVYKNMEEAVPNVNLKPIINILREIPTKFPKNLPITPGQDLDDFANNLGSAVGQIPGALHDLGKNLPTIGSFTTPKGSFNLCSIIPHCKWKISYSCRTKKWGVSCSGSNHLSCTYSSSCASLVPSVPAIPIGGTVTTLKNLINQIATGSEAVVALSKPLLVQTIKELARNGDEFGNTLEDILDQMGHTNIDPDFNKLKDALQNMGDMAREGFDDLVDNKYDDFLVDQVVDTVKTIANKGGNGLETLLESMGRELPKALTMVDDPIKELLEEIDKIDFDCLNDVFGVACSSGSNEPQMSVLTGNNLQNKFSIKYNDNALASNLKSVKVFKNGVLCNLNCQNGLFYGDKLVVQINPQENIQIKEISATGTRVQSAGLNYPNTVIVANKGSDIELNVVLSSKSFINNPNITFVDTETFYNNVKSDHSGLSIYISNEQGSTEMLVSESNNCSTGSYQPFNKFYTYSIPASNQIYPLSFRFKNGNKYSNCIKYSLYHDTVNPVVNSSYTLLPSNNCLLIGECDSKTISFEYNSQTLANNIESIIFYKNNQICDQLCMNSLMIGDIIGVKVKPNRFIKVKDILQNGSFKEFQPVLDGQEVSFLVSIGTMDVNLYFILEEATLDQINQSDITTDMSLNNLIYYTKNNVINFNIATSSFPIQSILISDSNNCSNGSYVAINNSNAYNVITANKNSNFPVSIKFKNIQNESNCFYYNVIHDDISPILTASLNKVYSNGDSLILTGTCESISSDTVFIKRDTSTESSVICSNNSFTKIIDTSASIQGLNNIEIYQNDKSNNKGIINISYTFDTTPPVLTVQNTSYDTHGENISLTGQCEGTLPIIITEGAKNTNYTCSNGTYSISYEPSLTVGTYNLNIKSTDLSGNLSQVSSSYTRYASTISCGVLHGTGISTWQGSSYGPCVIQSCDAGYDLDVNYCRLTLYHIFILAGERNMTGVYPSSALNCNNTNQNDRILQYSRGLNIGGLCPYTATPKGTYIKAIDPLQYKESQSLTSATGVLSSAALRFANKYLANIHANDKIVLIPTATTSGKFLDATISIGSVTYNDIVSITNEVINNFGQGSQLKGMIYQGGEGDYVSLDSSKNYAYNLSNYFTSLRTQINGAINMPIIVGSLCDGAYNDTTAYASILNQGQQSINQYISNVQYVSGSGITCNPTAVDYAQLSTNTLGDRYYNAYINTAGFNASKVLVPITDITISENKSVVNQPTTGIGLLSVTGGTPPYTFTTSTSGFSIIDNTLLANNLSLGNNSVVINVQDNNNQTFSKTLTINTITPTISTQSVSNSNMNILEYNQTTSGTFLDFENTSWTFSGLIYTGNSYTTNTGTLFDTRLTTGTKRGVWIALDQGLVTVRLQEDVSAPLLQNQNFVRHDSYDKLKKNMWHLITVVYDATKGRNNRITVYDNGVLFKVAVSNYAPGGDTTLNIGNTNNVRLLYGTNNDNGLSLPADMFMFWNSTMTASEVLSLYNGMNPQTHAKSANLVHYYKFQQSQDSNGLSLFDSVTNSSNVNLTSGVGLIYSNYVIAR